MRETPYQRRRRWQREEAKLRWAVRPLRNAVNLVLKRAGLPKSFTSYSSQVRGWANTTTTGYETSSHWMTESISEERVVDKWVEVEMFSSGRSFEPSENELFRKARGALEQDGRFSIEEERTTFNHKLLVRWKKEPE